MSEKQRILEELMRKLRIHAQTNFHRTELSARFEMSENKIMAYDWRF